MPTVIISSDPQGRHQCRRLLGSSLQDFIAIGMPYLVLLAAGMIGACIIYDPTMKLLLYSALPERYQNWLSFGILWVEELRLMIFGSGIGVPVWQLQIIAFDTVNNNLQAMMDSMLER